MDQPGIIKMIGISWKIQVEMLEIANLREDNVPDKWSEAVKSHHRSPILLALWKETICYPKTSTHP